MKVFYTIHLIEVNVFNCLPNGVMNYANLENVLSLNSIIYSFPVQFTKVYKFK